MTSLTIFALTAGIYFAIVYFLFFIVSVADDSFNYDADGFIIWAWPASLPLALIMFCAFGIISLWEGIIVPVSIKRICRRTLFYFSLPFRPVTLGRLVRERYHLS